MKWGIRRTPEQFGYKVRRQARDLTAKTIPAGTKCFRIATKDDPGVTHGKDTYVAYLPVDRANIRSISPWLMQVRNEPLNKAYEREYEITKDIKVASYEEVAAIRRELMSEKDYRNEAAGNFAENKLRGMGLNMNDIGLAKQVAAGMMTPEEAAKEGCKKANIPKEQWDNYIPRIAEAYADGAKTYMQWGGYLYQTMHKIGANKLHEVSNTDRLFANMAMDMAYGREGGINKQTLQTELKKRGYDAMYDNGMISVNSMNRQEAYEPLILFDGGTLKETSGRYLTDWDVAKAELENRKWMAGVEKDANKKRILS